VQQGMIAGLVASLLLVIYESTRPHISSLGHVPNVPGAYSDLARHSENIPVPGVLIVRLDAPMYYANALTFRGNVKTMIEEAKTQLRAVLFDAGIQYQLDLTSADTLKKLVKELQSKGISVYFADVRVPVREFSQRTGLLGVIGEDHLFPTVDAAVNFLETTACLA
jgi:SulP family sulfate permease